MALKPIQVPLYMPISLRLSENWDTIGWERATQGLCIRVYVQGMEETLMIFTQESFLPSLENQSSKLGFNLESRDKVYWGFLRFQVLMVKWTKKVFQYLKTMVFWVKHLKVVAKCCLNWFSLMLTSVVVLSTGM